MTEPVAGVDGGATRSRCVVMSPDGEVLGRASGGSAVARESSAGIAAAGVEEVVLAAAEDAGVELPLRALWAGLAGAGREGARLAVEERLRETTLARAVRVGTDVEAAFHDAFQEGPGILLVAGTGSIGWGRGEEGESRRVGGWGPLLGDEGSGYRIGLQALRAVVRESDRRGRATELGRVILGELELGDPGELVAWTEGASRAEVAALAPAVVRTAEGGDAPAEEIVAEAVEALREHLLVVLTELGPWGRPPEVALAGGLLDPGGPLRKRMEAMARGLGARPRSEPVDAARGAASLALGL